jgi:predicted deacylase
VRADVTAPALALIAGAWRARGTGGPMMLFAAGLYADELKGEGAIFMVVS